MAVARVYNHVDLRQCPRCQVGEVTLMPEESWQLCAMSFFRASDMKRHQLKHSDYKQFCCGSCGKCFKYKRHVASHCSGCS